MSQAGGVRSVARPQDECGVPDPGVEEHRQSSCATIDYASPKDDLEGKGGGDQYLDDSVKEDPLLAGKATSSNHQADDESESVSFIRASGGTFLSRSIPVETLTERSLSRDTFSFLIYTRTSSRPSILAGLVFCLQTAIFSLVMVDIIDPDNTGNPFNFPPNVEATVRVTEVLAIAVAIITQDEARKAINLMRDGYDEEVFRGTFGHDVTKAKWMLSIVLRGLEGLLGLFVTFMLIMQSETVLDLLLNFSAMEFVSLIDDVAFSLTTEGFFGHNMRREATALSIMKYRVEREENTWKATIMTAAYFIVLFIAMLTGWGIIFVNQSSGKYLCSQIFLQLDDSLVPSLGMLSGEYHVNRHLSIGGRVTAYQEYGGKIGYCKEEKMWAVVLQKQEMSDQDLCNDWVAAVPGSSEFDITATATSQWYARTQSGRVLPIDHAYIECYDCKNEENMCGESSSNGICNVEYRKCSCAKNRYGLRCEFEMPCSILEVDPRSEGFVGNRAFASTYYLLQDYDRYDRPVYTSQLGVYPDSSQRDVDVISFIGRRWVVTSGGMPVLPGSATTSLLNVETSFISEAVDIDGRIDLAAHPLGLEWHPALGDLSGGPDLSRSVDVTLFCAVCNNQTNPCHYNGICGADGSCTCSHGATGTMCQIPPTANGQCDQYFNKATFEYDGGDCCENSCVSTNEFTCGKDGANQFVDIDYSHCNTTKHSQWVSSGSSVYGVNSAARSGSSVALGRNGGTVLAVGDPGASVVRLFDKDGSKWVQRGRTIEGPPNSDFGFAISLSGESENVRRNAFSSPVITLAIGAPGAGHAMVYQCETNGCMQVGSDLAPLNGESRFGVSVSLSEDGTMIAIGAQNHNYEALVFKRSLDFDGKLGSDWELRGSPVSRSPYRRELAVRRVHLSGYYLSLSRNGDSFAMGTLMIEGTSGTLADFDSADLFIQMYNWDETSEAWVPVGDEIPKSSYLYDTPRADWPSRPIVLSRDATTLAIGSNRSVEVYAWDDSVSNWVSRDVDLNITESMGLVGWSVDLSADGSILAIGTSIENQIASSESTIRVHKWNGTQYSPFFNGVPAGETSAVALSSDGKALAVGLPFSEKNGGSTSVYKFRLPADCADNEHLLRISFTTDGNPYETRWTLAVGSLIVLQSQSYDDSPFTTFVEETCVPKDSCIKFRVFDSKGNGLGPPGVYSLMLDGEEVARGADFKYGVIERVGNCECTEGTSLLSILAVESQWPLEWVLLGPNETNMGEYLFHGMMENDMEIFDECIPEGCWYLTNAWCNLEMSCLVYPNWFYNVTFNGISWSDTGGCEVCPAILMGECSPKEEAAALELAARMPVLKSMWPTHPPTISGSPTVSLWPTYSPTMSGSPTVSPYPTNALTMAISTPFPTYAPWSRNVPATPFPIEP